MAEEFNLNDAEEIITLTMDDDSEVECVVLSVFEAGKGQYIALLPINEVMGEEEDGDGDVFLYRFSETEDGELNLQNIETDEEYEVVSEAFSQILDEMEAEEELGELE